MLFVLPNLILEDFSKAKLAPMINSSPVLAERCGMVGTRGSTGTLFRKEFPGGFINLAGASSPAALSMQSVRIVWADEIDRFPARAGKETDPLDLAFKRSQTFGNRKLIVSSTPRLKGISRIDDMFAGTDQRYFHVPMPCCGVMHALVWDNIKWREGSPETAEYCCADGCGTLLSDAHLKLAIQSPKALWVARYPEIKSRAGFHIWQIYSPWSSMAEIVRGYEETRNRVDRFEGWVNTTLGESFDAAENNRTTPEAVHGARMDWPEWVIPKGACVVTAAVDVQQYGLEVLFTAFGPKMQAWLLKHLVIDGDPTGTMVWTRLEELLQRRWPQHGHAHIMRSVEGVAIDSGNWTQHVYDFTAKAHRRGRPWYAIKGQPGPAKLAWAVSKTRLKGDNRLYNVGVDSLKDEVAARLASSDPTENKIYIRRADEFTLERIEQLFSERVHRIINSKGFEVREWHKLPGKRNELWDLCVYSDAVHRSLAIDHDGRLKAMTVTTAPNAADIAKMFDRDAA
jgi:phage terminase large subunit GpA-like protein